jgi:phosphatidate cytidylyltransferase
MPPMPERNLFLRIASGVVALPLLGLLVFWRQTLPFVLLALAAVAVGLTELGRLTIPDAPARARVVLVLLGTAFAAGVCFRPGLALVWAMAAVVLLGIDVLTSHGELRGAVTRLALSAFGIFYVGGLLAAMPLLRQLDHGSLWVTTAVAVTFVNDTGAYLAGRTLGRHKLAPAISPGKTVEGFIGGLAAGIGFMFVARATYFPPLTVTDVVAIGVAAGVLGPAGDLLESLIKRAAGAKDSGRLIPGHGGILDRIDALLFVGAYVYIHARYLHGLG